jgi:chromosome partitioning protein
MEIYAIANQKGGVTKTTTTYNLAAGLAMRGRKVLMVDLDSQASLTISAGLEPLEFSDRTIAEALQDIIDRKATKSSIKDYLYKIPDFDSLYIIPSIIDLAVTESKMSNAISREHILSRLLNGLSDDFDYCLIDCAPSLGILTINALTAADQVVIPCKTDYLSYRGMRELMNTIETVQELLNKNLKVFGVIATLKERTKDDENVLEQIKEEYEILAVIRKSVSVREAIYEGVPIMASSGKNAVAKEIREEYTKIVDKILEEK